MNSHKFSLKGYDVYGGDLQFFYDHVIRPNMSGCYNDMRFFNAFICNDDYTVVVYLR